MPSTIGVYVEAAGLFFLLALRQVWVATGGPAGDAFGEVVEKYIHVVWMGGVVLALFGFRQAIEVGHVRFDAVFAKTPMRGTFRLVNGYASFLAVGAAASLGSILFAKSGKTRALLGLAGALQLAAVIMNGSRGALLGFIGACAAGVVVHVIACIYRPESHVPAAFVRPFVGALRSGRMVRYAAVSGIIGALGLTTFGLHRLDPESGRGRLIEWETALPMVADHPLTGVGKGRYGVAFLEYQADYFSRAENQTYDHKANELYFPHNDYLGEFVETGAVGGVLFLLVVAIPYLFLISEIVKGRKLFYLLLIPYSAIVFHSMVSYTIHMTPTYAVLVSFIGLAPLTTFRVEVGRYSNCAILGVSAILVAHVLGKSYSEYRGYAYWRAGAAGSFETSIQYFKEAEKRLPPKGALLGEMGRAYLSVGDYEKATSYLERAAEKRGRKDPQIDLCRSYLYGGQLKKSEACFQEVLATFSELLEPRYYLGKVYVEMGDTTRSKKMLERCIEQRTYFDSPAVRQVVRRSVLLWHTLYGELPAAYDVPEYIDTSSL